MKNKIQKWYKVTYKENGNYYEVLGRGKKEAVQLHKNHPDSTFEIIKRNTIVTFNELEYELCNFGFLAKFDKGFIVSSIIILGLTILVIC